MYKCEEISSFFPNLHWLHQVKVKVTMAEREEEDKCTPEVSSSSLMMHTPEAPKKRKSQFHILVSDTEDEGASPDLKRKKKEDEYNEDEDLFSDMEVIPETPPMTVSPVKKSNPLIKLQRNRANEMRVLTRKEEEEIYAADDEGEEEEGGEEKGEEKEEEEGGGGEYEDDATVESMVQSWMSTPKRWKDPPSHQIRQPEERAEVVKMVLDEKFQLEANIK